MADKEENRPDSRLPRTLKNERPAEGFQGQTRPGAAGERQAAEAVEAHLDAKNYEPRSLYPDKGVNDSGPDFGFVGTDPATQQTTLDVGDNKDKARVSTKDFADYAGGSKRSDYIADGLNQIPALGEVYGDNDIVEPLPYGKTRHAGTGYEDSYEMPDPSFYGEDNADVDDDAPDSASLSDVTARELGAEFSAQQEVGLLQFSGTTTGRRVSEKSEASLAAKGIPVTHVETQGTDYGDNDAPDDDAPAEDEFDSRDELKAQGTAELTTDVTEEAEEYQDNDAPDDDAPVEEVTAQAETATDDKPRRDATNAQTDMANDADADTLTDEHIDKNTDDANVNPITSDTTNRRGGFS